MKISPPIALAILIATIASPANAAQSSYLKINYQKQCNFIVSEDNVSSEGICKIKNMPTIYLKDGDARESISFGSKKTYESFSEFNNANNVIEWRSHKNEIHAAIIRFFVSMPDPNTGVSNKKSDGQYLQIHKVAKTTAEQSCVVGLVNALANKNANQLARKIADNYVKSFDCLTDQPQYHGNDDINSAQFNKYIEPKTKQ